MSKYTKKCKHCKKEFQTRKIDKDFCDANHKKLYMVALNPPQKSKHTCVMCGTEFLSFKKKAKTCSRKCIQDLKNKETHDQLRIDNNKKYENVPNTPTCKICGWKASSIHSHIVQYHKISVSEYHKQYNTTDVDVYSEQYISDKSTRMAGENNPGYQHGGTMSSFSTKFKNYEHLTKEQKQSVISTQIEKVKQTKNDNHLCTTRLDYYTSKGYTLEEATILRSNRQKTFSLDICIEKHGEKEGKKRWEQRQQKWLSTLDALPDEEKQRIYEAKIAPLQRKYSLISTEMFQVLNIPDALYGSNEKRLRIEKTYISPDFIIGNKIIEFYGDFWHANPYKYNSKDVVTLPQVGSYKKVFAEDIWERDFNRIKMLHGAGYNTLIIYERDYRKDPTGQVEKCLNFLNEN